MSDKIKIYGVDGKVRKATKQDEADIEYQLQLIDYIADIESRQEYEMSMEINKNAQVQNQ